MLCNKCKMEIPNGAKICPFCGSKQGIGCGGIILAVIIVGVLISILVNIGKGAREAEESMNSSETSSVQQLSKEDYIASCTEIAYSDLARNPDKYKGQAFHFRGKVVQTATEGNTTYLRINVTEGTYVWSDTIFAEVYLPKSADRILEDDIITLYGDCEGVYTYESIVGKQVSLPSISIRYFNIETE
ncbi:MAG: zinc ribbon domain-containing protein [Oscillospiraceae bacterium]|nr:zinc ribbon domain-containing protein [Oscillospiraceae bacterium]